MTPTAHIAMLSKVLAVPLLILLLAAAPGTAVDAGSSSWDLVTHMGDPVEVSGSWLHSASALPIEARWK